MPIHPQMHFGVSLVDQADARRSLIASAIRPFSSGRMMLFAESWDVSVRPHPWHAARLFDRDPFTDWNSREPATPRMAIEVQFREPRPIDGLEVVYPQASALSDSELVVRSLSASGVWSILDMESVEHRQLAVSIDAAQESAVAMLARHGITHVVLNLEPGFDHSAEMQSIASDPEAWSLHKTFVDRTATLYEVDTVPKR